MIYYYVSWTQPGASYTRCFDNEQERDNFSRCIAQIAKSVQTWEHTI